MRFLLAICLLLVSGIAKADDYTSLGTYSEKDYWLLGTFVIEEEDGSLSFWLIENNKYGSIKTYYYVKNCDDTEGPVINFPVRQEYSEAFGKGELLSNYEDWEDNRWWTYYDANTKEPAWDNPTMKMMLAVCDLRDGNY